MKQHWIPFIVFKLNLYWLVDLNDIINVLFYFFIEMRCKTDVFKINAKKTNLMTEMSFLFRVWSWPSKSTFAKTARSCRFALHNIRKIRPFLTEHAAQLLVQDLVNSRLDYFNALLAGLPSNTIKPLQMIQNALATGCSSAPTYFHSLMTIYIPSRSLRSASERRLVVPSQRGSKSLSRMFSFTTPGW